MLSLVPSMPPAMPSTDVLRVLLGVLDLVGNETAARKIITEMLEREAAADRRIAEADARDAELDQRQKTQAAELAAERLAHEKRIAEETALGFAKTRSHENNVRDRETAVTQREAAVTQREAAADQREAEIEARAERMRRALAA